MYLVSEIIDGEHNVMVFKTAKDMIRWLKQFLADFGNTLIVTPNNYYRNIPYLIHKYEKGETI